MNSIASVIGKCKSAEVNSEDYNLYKSELKILFLSLSAALVDRYPFKAIVYLYGVHVIAAEWMYHPYHFDMYHLYHFQMYHMPQLNQCQLKAASGGLL